MRRCFPRRRGRGHFARGNGRACHKVMILFWDFDANSPFFHAGCASCGVLAGDSGAGVGENRGGFWEILAADVGRFRSSFRRFSWAFWGRVVGGGLVLASRRARATKKGASDSTRAVGCTEKGDHGAEIRRKLVLSSSASGCRSPRGRRGGAVFVARPWPTAVGRRGSGVPW